ncbi:MAG: hypothetical protein DRI61_03390 [Chloroflexi bacterium]|nr:MAG: hypothetical protein DRI61_03390 [Chloroflexota bacterium]
MGIEVLVVDNDEAFATILKEGLESQGDYQVSIATSGEEALTKVVEGSFRLAIVDMGLKDMEALTLLKALREVKPSLRMMVIPVDDEEVQLNGIEILGTIPKPFFIGELSDLIKEALSRKPIYTEEAKTAAPSSSSRPSSASPAPAEIFSTLEKHQGELNAYQIAFGKPPEAPVWVGGEEEKAHSLYSWVTGIFEGELPLPGRRETGELYYRGDGGSIYALRMDKGFILAAVFYTDVPLGMVRFRMKRLEEELRKLVERQEE